MLRAGSPALRPPRGKPWHARAAVQHRWPRASVTLCCIACAFLALTAYTQTHLRLLGGGGSAAPAAERRELASLPCNPRATRVATCAHRINAAELLRRLPAHPRPGSSSSSSAAAARQQQHSLVGQMQLLWEAGVRCFDVDLVSLRGGELLVGHPGDLAARVHPEALDHGRDRAGGNSAAGRRSAAGVSPETLHAHALQELRSAGLDEAAAPTLPVLLAAFKQLLSHEDGSSRGTSLAAAAAARSWRGVPVLNLEVKGQAAMRLQPWIAADAAAAAAGVRDHVVLWMRQINEAGSGSKRVVVTELARQLARALNASSSSRAGHNDAQQEQEQQQQQGQATARPLLGLIVPDLLLQQPHLTAVARQGDAFTLASALVATAGGLLPASGAGSDHSSSSSSSNGGGAAAQQQQQQQLASAGVPVLEAFDVLAPSVKLPARVLELLLRSHVCCAWTMSSAWHRKKAMWLGLDCGITNEPMAQEAALAAQQDSVCERPP